MSDESLFREVDEEVRQEQYKKIWARYGNLIVAASLAVIVAVAGYKGWEYWQVKQAETAGDSFFAATKLASTGKTDEAAKQFEAIGHKGFAALAKLREANGLAAQGKAAEAVKIYDAVAADGGLDPALRDLARIRAAMALTDSAAPGDLKARVEPFDRVGNPWRHTAREVMAAAYWRLKDYGNANTQVKAILDDPETPAGIRKRAQILSELLAPLVAQK